MYSWQLAAHIQNVADPQQNGHIGKDFELVEHYRCKMECDFHYKAIFLYHFRNHNCNRNPILNPRLPVGHCDEAM